MSNDPRVAEAMRLHKISTKSHHVWQTLRALGEPDEKAQAAVDDHARLLAYLAAEFAKVPSAPVEAVPQLPHPGSSEASEAIDAMLKEYDYPANTKNAARAGYQAARRMLATNPPQAGPSIEQQLQNAREDFAAMKALKP